MGKPRDRRLACGNLAYGGAAYGRLACALLAVAFSGCGGRAETLPNLVLVTLDTTRADRLGPYGFEGATTPALDAFADRAVVYEEAYATSSWTLPSHASIFTGLLPMQHGAQTATTGDSERLGYPVRPLAEHFDTLAERLAAAGYRTAGFVAGPALARELGAAQGFERYEDDLSGPGEAWHGRRAADVADAAIAFVEEAGPAPFFLFVNFFDPHAPYRPPPPFDRGLPGEAPDPGAIARAIFPKLASDAESRPVASLGEPERRGLAALLAGYDAEIAYMDRHLGRLLAALDAADRAERTLVAITSDHGESFGEHYYLSHGAHLYQDNVRVPLLIRLPESARARRAGEPVQNHRLFATLLAAAGVALPEGVPVRPLRPEAAGGAGDAPIVTEVRRSLSNIRLFGDFFDRDLRALYEPPWKLIDPSRGEPELYHLVRDPGELDDLAAAEPDRVRALRRRLALVAAAHPPRFEASRRADLDAETERALRALGYLD